jgi:hypothetical protein
MTKPSANGPYGPWPAPGRVRRAAAAARHPLWPPASYSWPGPAPCGYPDRDPRAFVPPLVATVLTAPVIAVDAVITMVAPMATDSCPSDGCATLDHALVAAVGTLFLAVMTLAASWLLPWRRRFRARRVVFAVAAPLFAAVTALIYLHLPAPG